LESKKTLEFLKYSLGKRSPVKGKFNSALDQSMGMEDGGE
jgi:hypothetical protein